MFRLIKKLKDPNVQDLSLYFLVFVSLLTVIVVLRVQSNELSTTLQDAQLRYDLALKEQQRIQLELEFLLSPSTLERHIETVQLSSRVQYVNLD